MCSINAYSIQEKIRQIEYVSIPWIQKEYSLNYKDAKEFLSSLQRRNWIEYLPVGIRYPVVHKNLQLRKINRDEINGLIEDITHDCVAALVCIQKLSASGASLSDIESAVRGEDDTQVAVEILIEHKLIFSVCELYFATVSKKTIDVLSDVVSRKRRIELNREVSGKPANNKQLVKLFDVLFKAE